MVFNSFGYRGNFVFTPPIVFQNDDKNLIILASPYGNRGDLENCLSQFLDEFNSRYSDKDSTSPYSKLTCFNDHENLLYTSLQFLNDFMFSNYNKHTINLGCDFICLYKVENVLYFSQAGWPLILMHQNHKTLPLSADYSFTPENKSASPFIPSSLFGLDSSFNIKIQQINFDQHTELLMLKSNQNPDSLMSLYPCPINVIANTYASLNPLEGFWIGTVKI